MDKAHIMTDKEKLYKFYHYNLNGQTKDESFKTRDEENNYINNKICSTTKNILMNIRYMWYLKCF